MHHHFRFTLGALAALLMLVNTADAAEQYFRPSVLATVEDHSNVDLTSGSQTQNLMGYAADLQSIWGIRTPRSTTEFAPRVVFQKIQSRENLSRAQEYLDFKTNFLTRLSSFDLFGRFNRLDSYQYERGAAQFNEFDPGATGSGQSGRVLVGNIRTLSQIRPRYSYTINQLTDVGVLADFQHVQFSNKSSANQRDYDFGVLNGFVTRKIGVKNQVVTGVYASKYESKDKANRTNAVGLSFEWSHQWANQFRGTFSVGVERSKLHELDLVIPATPVYADNTATNWSAGYTASYTGQVSRIRLTVGRELTPSSRGDKSAIDQVRLQYDRALSSRLDFTGAIRFLKEKSPKGGLANPNDRDYGTADLHLRWALSRTWYVQGGYRYFRQKHADLGDSAQDHVLQFGFGYVALPPQR